MLLTYHEITPEPSAYGYSCAAATMGEHLALLSELRQTRSGDQFRVVTFDDGHASQHRFGLPALEQHGCRGIFFVTAGWTGVRPEYMSWTQLREVVDAGHQVQAHGWEHALMTGCSDEQLRSELERPKKTLEDRLGIRVETLSAPGGRWDMRVVEACRAVGYTKLYTSNPWQSTSSRGGVELVGRVMIRRTMTADHVRRLLEMRGTALWVAKTRYGVKETAKSVLGDRLYQKVWDVFSASSKRQEIHEQYRG